MWVRAGSGAEVPATEPVALEDLAPYLALEVLERTAARTLSSTLPVQVWAHRPGAAVAWVRLLAELQENSCLDARLRELVRLRVAAHTRCRTCSTGRKTDDVTEDDIACLGTDDERFTPVEQAALRYTDLFCSDHMAVDDRVYEELAVHLTLEQVVELQMLVAVMLAGGRLAYVQRAWTDDDRPPVLTKGVPCVPQS